jgi:predicted ribosomally synthesized peptide with nif11-like leader
MLARTFENYIATLPNNEADLREFLTTIRSPDDMVEFAKSKGYKFELAEAKDLLARGTETAKAELSHLSDEELETVTGGLSWGAIGAIAGAIVGAGVVVANAAWMIPVAGTVSLLTGMSIPAMIGSVGLTAVATGFSGAVVVGGTSAIADKVVNG